MNRKDASTAPGEQRQMVWGFVNVDKDDGGHYRGTCYIEFFPNAKQENQNPFMFLKNACRLLFVAALSE